MKDEIERGSDCFYVQTLTVRLGALVDPQGM